MYDQTQGYGVKLCFFYFTDISHRNILTPEVMFPFLGNKTIRLIFQTWIV
jgi:hypothetical protein